MIATNILLIIVWLVFWRRLISYRFFGLYVILAAHIFSEVVLRRYNTFNEQQLNGKTLVANKSNMQ